MHCPHLRHSPTKTLGTNKQLYVTDWDYQITGTLKTSYDPIYLLYAWSKYFLEFKDTTTIYPVVF